MSEKVISIMGCGWLGTPLAEKLLLEGWAVKGSTTHEGKLSQLAEKGVDPYLITLTPEGVEGNVVTFLDTDVLIVNVPPGRSSPTEANTYPSKIRRLVGKLTTNNFKGGIFISSTSVYGNLNGKVTENTLPSPETASGKALLEVENELLESAFPWSVLRLGGLIGPARHPGRFFRQKREIAKGDAPVNLISLEDVIGLLIAMIHSDLWGNTYHLASTHHPTKRAFYTEAVKAYGWVPPTFLPGGAKAKEIDSTHTLQSLSYDLEHENLFKYLTHLTEKAGKV
ncbi:MAG: SDR family NAD(P)-dependent oxidoreductase [Bacteroidota bacterium]